jgi:putative glutamine amidotransferase
VSRPVIGITGALERARYRVWDEEVILMDRHYVDQVQRAGGVAVILPPDRAPEDVLEFVHGLVLTGGSDIGDEPARDHFELELARLAMERDVPLLGVCRGMQVMNVARGGTLIEHIPDTFGHEDHRRVLGAYGDHDVRLADGSLAARVAGGPTVPTKSHHHQGVDSVGEGLTVTGWAVMDDLPEALEDHSKRFALGVQWHPEADEDSPYIAALVNEARVAAAAR